MLDPPWPAVRSPMGSNDDVLRPCNQYVGEGMGGVVPPRPQLTRSHPRPVGCGALTPAGGP